ncbi:Aspartyl/asparaginy/proline hydroxylase [uncultured Caudovirales phage]|uniref:Aspartyl/asparaginy/proline hydroxylase n=1 Tax=uncultured Caudovirales phage TaxID=2100421 RepID=A0A6J5T9Y0_9CAUD|nr:Aspartyl/asparaginy/proline hydroxylase [uncultured Caudovirales phage]CAB4210693.1 Aspartyl/asparaginy/proline hydroxylase [uncultured Caudovirales phage]CAB4223277.1 Aspartyl/asparaginy/proline hydroxylase [uncultured Caudovirales phage]
MFRSLGKVDITGALETLATAHFLDTGGTNGWLADSTPFMKFIKSLPLPGVVTGVNVRLLPAHQGIPPHIDPKFKSRKVIERRFHIPLTSHEGVRMRWPDDGVEAHLEVGELYEVDHHRLHEVINCAPVGRVHIVIDTAEAA